MNSRSGHMLACVHMHDMHDVSVNMSSSRGRSWSLITRKTPTGSDYTEKHAFEDHSALDPRCNWSGLSSVAHDGGKRAEAGTELSVQIDETYHAPGAHLPLACSTRRGAGPCHHGPN